VAHVVDGRVAARLVALETADVEVPAPPGVARRPPLYFRILPAPRESLRVELWELGRPYGARTVSSTGTQNLEARRIALAAAELARQLRERRFLEIAAARREKSAPHAPSSPPTGIPIYGRMAWSGGARAATIGVSDAWLVGPHADASLRFSSGPRLTLGGAWLAGRADLGAVSGTARWLEVGLALSETISLAPSVELDIGLAAALASVRVASGSGDASAVQDLWSARGGALGRVEMALSRHVTLAVGPDVGAVLRPLDIRGPGITRHRLGGLWLGGALTIVVGPSVVTRNGPQ
jgi:hypothetical protein